MLLTEPLLIEFQYKNEAHLAWATLLSKSASEYLVETLTPIRRHVIRRNRQAEWEENGEVSLLSMCIGKGIESEW